MEKLAASMIERQLTRRNCDVYERRMTLPRPMPKYDYVPRSIYFYYVRIDEDGLVRVDHYFYYERDPKYPNDPIKKWKKISHRRVPSIIRKLAKNGRLMPRRLRRPRMDHDHNFENVKWNRKSYIAIFFDEAYWQFHRRDNGKPSVAFDPIGGEPNYSFFDAKDIRFRMKNQQSGKWTWRTAIYFVNHMKRNSQGDDLVWGDTRKYKFDMYLAVAFADTYKEAMTVIFDPGGENQGPPEKP